MRIFVLGLVCVLFSGAVFADVDTATVQVPSKSYVENASNLTAGTVNAERLPIGQTEKTVAAGDDSRFDSISLGRPGESTGRAQMWIE